MSGQNTYTVWTKYISCLDKYHILSGQISYPVLTNTISCLCKYHILSGQILYPVLTNIISCLDKYHMIFGQMLPWFISQCDLSLFFSWYFVIPTYICDVHPCHLVDHGWHLDHDVQHLPGDPGCPHLPTAVTHHRDLLGLGQGGSYLCSYLGQSEKSEKYLR